MKKVICAAAAFAMVAGIATVASAEVKLSGDARARLVYKDNGVKDSYSKWDSRFRVVVAASTESGVYGKARLRFLDGDWDGSGLYAPSGKVKTTTTTLPNAAGEDVEVVTGQTNNNVWTDYAYLGFKTGAFNVSAGRQPTNFSKWFSWDGRADRLKVAYKDGGMLVAYTYDQLRETTDLRDDKYVHGVTFKQKFSDTMSMGARVVYVMDDMNDDRDGIKASVNLPMNFGGNQIMLEQAWIQGDVLGTDKDDAFGGYASWSANFGSVTPTVMAGYTQDGYKVDDDFGWIMIGAAWGITEIAQVGQGGDTMFLGATADMAVSEQLSLQGNLVYMDVDTALDDTVVEVSGMVNYKVVKGADLSFKLGYLDYADSDSVLNGVVRLDVGF